MGKIKGWYFHKSFRGKNVSYAWINLRTNNYLFIKKRKLHNKTLWYIDYREAGWKVMTVKGGKHTEDPYKTAKEARAVAIRFMKKYPNG